MGWEGATVVGSPQGELPVGLYGSYLTLIGDEGAVQIGFMASLESCLEISKTLLGMGPEDELPESDMADAIAEVINIVAGSVKTRMISYDAGIKLGLPTFIQGRIMATPNQEKMVSAMKFGSIDTWILVLRPKRS